VIVIVWLLNLQFPLQSVPIITKVVSSNPTHVKHHKLSSSSNVIRLVVHCLGWFHYHDGAIEIKTQNRKQALLNMSTWNKTTKKKWVNLLNAHNNNNVLQDILIYYVQLSLISSLLLVVTKNWVMVRMSIQYLGNLNVTACFVLFISKYKQVTVLGLWYRIVVAPTRLFGYVTLCSFGNDKT
jgi:hypothetical protein